MLERDVVAAIARVLKTTPGCFFWKEHGGMYGTAGIPDIICCFRGRFVAFEVKNETGRLSKLQAVTIDRIRECGGSAHVVRSAVEVKEILRELGEEQG